MTLFRDILRPTDAGLYCPPGDFYVDPVRAVPRAVISHGHSDHARPGHGAVLATRETLAIMAARYGERFAGTTQQAGYGESVMMNGVKATFAPAGHVLGSAQVVIEHAGRRLVVSGDYKRRRDPTCAPFEPIPCDVFISEATFALPVFRHPDAGGEIARLLRSVAQFPERTHLVGAYALGKAQRIIRLLREAGYDAPIYIHGAMEKLCALYQSFGVDLGRVVPASADAGDAFKGAIVIAPPSAFADRWARRFPDPLACFASGWMRIRQRARQSGVELALIISDHADWDELTATVTEIGPEQLWVTHGRDDALVRWASLHGLNAEPLALAGYEDENE